MLEPISFNEFKEYVLNHFKEALPEDKRNVKLEINEVTKNNGLKLTGLTVKPEGSDVAPNIYLEDSYNKYLKCRSLDETMAALADTYIKHAVPADVVSNIRENFSDFSIFKDKIFMTVVGRERNAEFLNTVPHTNREDLSLIYKVYVGELDDGFATLTIRNEHLDIWGVTVEELHELAMKNTREILPVTVQTMGEVVAKKSAELGLPMPGDVYEMVHSVPENMQQYVISNKRETNGATSIFYEDVLTDLAEKIGTDLYILPSSIHECIAMSCDSVPVDCLAQMVAEINKFEVAPEMQLSDHVYRFDAKARTLKLADVSLEDLGLDKENDMVRPLRRGR